MSRRPSLDKKVARLRKMTRTPLPRSFDLVDWLKDRRHAQTTGEANHLILSGRVRCGSHVVGIIEIPTQRPDGKLGTQKAVQRFQPVKYRDELIVLESE